jgi:hypothetical protein
VRTHQTNMRLIVSMALPAFLAGCATSSADFPSLAIREGERVTGTIQPAPGVPWVSPPAPAEALGRLGGLEAQAQTAHSAFLSQAQAARGTVAAGRGAEEGSDAWARAEIALASLQSARAPALIAMAELDRIYVGVLTEAAEVQEIAATRENVLAMVETEDRLIQELNAVIAP